MEMGCQRWQDVKMIALVTRVSAVQFGQADHAARQDELRKANISARRSTVSLTLFQISNDEAFRVGELANINQLGPSMMHMLYKTHERLDMRIHHSNERNTNQI